MWKRVLKDAQEVLGDREAFTERARKRVAKILEDRASEVRSSEKVERKLIDLKGFRTSGCGPSINTVAGVVADVDEGRSVAGLLQRSKPSGQEQSRTVDPGCGKILFHDATRMSCGRCEVANWTCKMRKQQGISTSWRGCAKLWLPQRRSCQRYRPFSIVANVVRVIEEQDLCPIGSIENDTQAILKADDAPRWWKRVASQPNWKSKEFLTCQSTILATKKCQVESHASLKPDDVWCRYRPSWSQPAQSGGCRLLPGQ